MFYTLAKTFWAVATLPNFIGLGLVLAATALFAGFGRSGKWLIVFLTAAYLACGFGPVGALLLRPLEDRFPPPPQDMPPPDGIIVLGGAIDDEVTAARNIVTFNPTGARLAAAVALSRRFPQAKLVYSGGSDKTAGPLGTEADAARALFQALGVESDRMTFESRSRDTFENALFTRELLQPKPDSRWLLVTSAFHMPRSVATFRKAGFAVAPYPADYLTLGDARDYFQPQRDATHGLEMTALGLHEWIGLAVYRLAGRTDSFFPQPVDEARAKTR